MGGVGEAVYKALKVSHPRTVRLYAQSVKGVVAFSAQFPTGGDSGTLFPMDLADKDDGGPPAQNILGDNLNLLYAQAKRHWAAWKKRDHGPDETPPPPASDHALAEKCKVSRKTLAAIRNEGRPAQLDTVDAIARAYGLRAYQLLVPGIDLDNPVTVPVTETERELVRAFRESMRRIKQGEQDEGGGASEVVSDSGNTSRSASRKKVGQGTK